MKKNINIAKLKEFANTNNLEFDNNQGVAFGNIGGYDLAIRIYFQTGNLIVYMNLEGPEGIVTEETFKDLKNGTQKIDRATIVKNGAVAFQLSKSYLVGALFENLQIAINSLIPYLKAKNLISSCFLCSAERNTTAYAISGLVLQVCDNCAPLFSEKLAEQNELDKAKKEKIGFGVVGALLGSLIGVAAIVIISQLGYVAAISGALLAFCTLKGYVKLAGKLSKTGIIISIAIMVIMTLFGNRLDWAVYIMREIDIDILSAYMLVPEIADQSSYNYNLIMVGIFAIGGSIGTIVTAFKNQAADSKLIKLENNSIEQ